MIVKCLRLKKLMCYHGTNGEILWTQGHNRGCYTCENKHISDTRSTKNTSQLKSYLSIINYDHKSQPILSAILAPLHKLLAKNEQWNWSNEQDQAFCKSKELMTSTTFLVHYGNTKEIGETTSGRSSRKTYLQIDSEGFAVVNDIKKFHLILYSQHFTRVTDHKPLLGL